MVCCFESCALDHFQVSLRSRRSGHTARRGSHERTVNAPLGDFETSEIRQGIPHLFAARFGGETQTIDRRARLRILQFERPIDVLNWLEEKSQDAPEPGGLR